MRALKAKIGQSRMIVRAPALWPAKQPFGLLDWEVVNRGVPAVHDALVIEFPVLVAIGTVPLPRIIPPFVLETDGNSISGKHPKLFDAELPRICTNWRQ